MLSSEVIVFADLPDAALALSKQIEQGLLQESLMHLRTDSKSLIDIIGKGTRTSGKRTMLDVHSARQPCRSQEISNTGFVGSSSNLADGLTKAKMERKLLNLVNSGKHIANCEQ